MTDHTILDIQNGIATITLNNPKKKNSLDSDMLNSLCDDLKACDADDNVRVVCLTNVGNTFCAGANLSGKSKSPPRYTLVEMFKLIRDLTKPVVGKINGHCMGGGVGLAAACDISVINSSSKVGFTEVRIGVSPAVISVVCLPKLRRGDALELMLSGEKISAVRAVDVGLYNSTATTEEIDEKVTGILNKLLRGGPNALRITKSLVYRVPDMRVEEAYQWSGEESMKCFQSEEARQGIQAFLKRKAAPWVPQAKL